MNFKIKRKVLYNTFKLKHIYLTVFICKKTELR